MRQPCFAITPAVVRRTAQAVLQPALPWKPYGRLVSVARLLGLVLLVAARRSSLSAVVRRFRCGFSHETARKAVHANLPDSATLTTALVGARHRLRGPRRRRRWVVAIDLHYCPFYGNRATPGIGGGQKKPGTHYSYGYATAELVHRRPRSTVGLLPLEGKFKAHAVVAALLQQRDERGVRLRGVVLDSGFDSGDTLLLLPERGLAYTVSLRRKGRGSNRRNACFALPVGTVTTVHWVTEESRQAVQDGGGRGATARGDEGSGLRLWGLASGAGAGQGPRRRGSAASAAGVSAAVRHRDELPAAARVPGADDGEGCGLSLAARGAGAAVAAGVGMADRAAGAQPWGRAEGVAG